MIKVAFFVEGQTEELLVTEIVKQLAKSRNYHLSSHKRNGSGQKLVKIEVAKIGDPNNHEIYFQICDCASDSQVLSALREEYNTLVAAGFSDIIAIRDLRPIDMSDLPKLQAGVMKHLPTGSVSPLFVIALVETEAWFIAENTHFGRIDPALNPQAILASTSVDITVDSETIKLPAETIRAIYQSVSKEYAKDRNTLKMTIEALSVPEYFAAAGARAKSIVPLVQKIRSLLI